MSTIKPSIIGETIHVLSAFTLASGFNSTSASRVVQRGETIVITEAHYEASKDRFGNSWLDEHLAPGFESGRIARGPWPEGQPSWTPGSRDWADAREQARLEAWRQPTEEAQMAALHEVYKKFGPSGPSNVTIREEKR